MCRVDNCRRGFSRCCRPLEVVVARASVTEQNRLDNIVGLDRPLKTRWSNLSKAHGHGQPFSIDEILDSFKQMVRDVKAYMDLGASMGSWEAKLVAQITEAAENARFDHVPSPAKAREDVAALL